MCNTMPVTLVEMPDQYSLRHRDFTLCIRHKNRVVRSCPTLDWPIQNHMYFIKDVHCLVLEYQGMKGIFILKMALNSSSINICFTYCSRPKPCAFKPPWRRDKMVSILVSPLGRGQLRLTLHPSRPSQYYKYCTDIITACHPPFQAHSTSAQTQKWLVTRC